MGAHRYTNDIINKSRTFLITDYIQSLIHQYASTTFFIIHHPSSPFIIIIHSSFIFTSSLPSSFDLYSLLLFFRASLSSSSLLSRQGNQTKVCEMWPSAEIVRVGRTSVWWISFVPHQPSVEIVRAGRKMRIFMPFPYPAQPSLRIVRVGRTNVWQNVTLVARCTNGWSEKIIKDFETSEQPFRTKWGNYCQLAIFNCEMQAFRTKWW